MPTDNLVKIILAIEDKVSEQAKKIDDTIKKFGNTASQSNTKVAQSADRMNKSFAESAKDIQNIVQSSERVGQIGAKQFDRYNESIQKSIVNFNRLDAETQDMLKYLSQMSDKGREAFINMSSKAQEAIAKFEALQNETQNWGNTLDYTRSKMQLMGTNVDSLKGKFQVVGTAIQTHIGNKWDGLKTKVTVFGDYIKTHLNSALSTVKSKIESLGDAFGGLGGVISSVFGAIGMNSVKEMTIGLSLNRDKVHSLGQSVFGAGAAFDTLWDKMDKTTTQGVVALDELSQAMATIKMATGASTEQLTAMMPVVNDIGQRAIMMGRSGEEAISLMQAAGKGLNGEFAMLQDNFGITKEKLQDLGWSGSAEDVEGYTQALQKYLEKGGNMNDLLDTTSGKLTTFSKNMRIAGRKIGDEFMPYLDMALDKLNEWSNPETGNGLGQLIIGVMGLSSAFMTLAPTITPALQAFDMLVGKGRAILTFLGLLEAEEGAVTAATLANTIATQANEVAQAARGVVTSGLVTENAALNASMAGLTAEEIAAAAAHATNSGALGAETVAAATAAGANTTLAGTLWAVTAAILANPITWIVVAVIALAVAVYEVGKAFGWWKDIPTLLEAVWAGLQRMWDAFINHPDVQAVISALSQAWDALVSAIGWVVQAVEEFFDIHVNGEFDVVHAIIMGIGAVWEGITAPIRIVISAIQFLIGVFQAVTSAIQTAQSKFGAFGGFLATLASPIIFVYELLKSIVCILLGCSPGIVPALEKVWEVFQTVFNAIVGFIDGVISPIIEAIQPLIDLFVEIVTFMIETFMPVWELLANILTVIWNSVTMVIQVFEAFLLGQISLPQLLSAIWNIIMTMFMTILSMIITFVWNWASQLVTSAINAASGFVNGIISFISGLPGKVWNYLVQVATDVLNAGSQWVSNARQKASEMVDQASTTVQQLPGKIYNEFIKVPDKIREAIPQAIAAALNFGKGIIDGVLNAMGIHSPGIVQNSIAEEIKNTVEKIKDAIKPAGDYATQLGDKIVENFGNPQLSLDTEDLTPYTDLDADTFENVDMGSIDTSGLGEATSITDSTNTEISDSYAALTASMTGSLNEMVAQDQLAYMNMQTNDLTAFNNISTGLSSTLTTMGVNLRTQLNLMTMTHQNAMNSANNTTRMQLNSMLNQTMNVTSQMRSAWSVMASEIISAADRIKREATAYFDQLSSTIGNFYRKLQNPSSWAGGDNTGSASTIRSVGRDPAIMHRLTRGVANSIRRDNQMPYTISASTAKRNRIIDPLTLEYMNKTSSSRIDVLDLLQSGICPNCVAGGWESVVNPNVSHIKNTARQWQMRGPAIHTGVGDIDTGLSFKVSDFENGTPNISWGSFVQIATAVASAIPYDYYYDSSKYGSWQNAIAHGAWNCFDGASAMVALANACGFGGYVDCGLNWGSDGHCAAIINGYTFDTTALRQRGGWTAGPCSYSHPAPSAGGINIRIPRGGISPRRDANPLEGLFDSNSSDSSSSEEVKVVLEHNLNLNLKDVPEHIDEATLSRMIKESADDESFVKRLAQNINFQKYDLKEKLRIERKNKRDMGVGI